jgi:hypothetical protein
MTEEEEIRNLKFDREEWIKKFDECDLENLRLTREIQRRDKEIKKLERQNRKLEQRVVDEGHKALRRFQSMVRDLAYECGLDVDSPWDD